MPQLYDSFHYVSQLKLYKCMVILIAPKNM